jgi:hypothetical protein
MKNWHATFLASVFVLAAAAPASAELGGQVFFRGGVAMLVGGDRGGEVFTDVNGAAGHRNDDKTGIAMGFGLDLPLLKDPWFGNTLLAEIVVDYARFSRNLVIQNTSALLGGSATSNVSVSQLAIIAAPKYRLQFGQVRPWLVPIGMEFLVNSPPSNDTTYQTPAIHFAAGIEYRLADPISLGVDARYNLGLGYSHVNEDNSFTAGAYLGFNF